MKTGDINTDVSTALVTGGAIAVGVAFALRSYLRKTALPTRGPDGKPLRPIHVLDANRPIIGDVVERVANGERLYDWHLEKMLQYNGEPWAIQIPGQPPMIMVTTPEAIEEITVRQFDVFLKGAFQNDRILDMFGDGLVASDGTRWLHQRKAAAKFFSANVLRTMMMENMQTNVDEVCAVIDRKMAEPGQLVDLKQLFHEFTLETFAEIGMGVDLNCIGAANPHPFQKALDVMAPITTRRFRVPGFVWETERWLNIGVEADMAKHRKILLDWLHETLEKSIKSARADKASESNGKTKSVVELFMEHSAGDVDGLQPDDLVGFVLTFIIGARDTTANTLSWLLYALSKHPQVEERLRAEIDGQLGAFSEHAFLTTDDIKGLVYLEATLKETVRLYPGAPFTARQAKKTTVICGETLIREGDVIGMSQYAMARHPLVWGPDAAEFKPERWIDKSTGQILNVPLTKYFSFSAGPRTCIGMNLAMLELRIVTANLLFRYKLDIDPRNDGSYEVAPTLNMKHPLLARATRVRGARGAPPPAC